MSTVYRAIHLLGKGGLDQLKEVELPLLAPGPGDLRIRVRATGAGSTDVIIEARLPLLAARQAQELLERGGVGGKIVHLRPN